MMIEEGRDGDQKERFERIDVKEKGRSWRRRSFMEEGKEIQGGKRRREDDQEGISFNHHQKERKGKRNLDQRGN